MGNHKQTGRSRKVIQMKNNTYEQFEEAKEKLQASGGCDAALQATILRVQSHPRQTRTQPSMSQLNHQRTRVVASDAHALRAPQSLLRHEDGHEAPLLCLAAAMTASCVLAAGADRAALGRSRLPGKMATGRRR